MCAIYCIEYLIQVILRHVLVKQIPQRADKYPPRLLPAKGMVEDMGMQDHIPHGNTLRVSLNSVAESLNHSLGIAIQAPGTNRATSRKWPPAIGYVFYP